MGVKLRSVGLDVGTTTTQLIVSELSVENNAGAFAVPEMTIAERKILYESPVHFTPLRSDTLVDGEAIRRIVTEEYEKAGITRAQVDTGAIIITGETSRKENAAAVLASLSDFAGQFVVATAGPDLESVLAARGAGAVELSEERGKTVLHMDIGGGTSNLAWIREGKILQTACLNVGGRLLKFGSDGAVTYVSPVLSALEQPLGSEEDTAQLLVQALEMAAGLRPPTPLLHALTTKETGRELQPMQADIISFSGGVADCIETEHPPLAFGDMGPALGKAIRRSRLCAGEYVLGRHTIRATVIGAGCHSTQLSGSTVFYRNVTFPLKNLPVIRPSELSELAACRTAHDGDTVLAMEGIPAANYQQITALADRLVQSIPQGPVYLVTERDMAKALGQALALRLPPDRPLLCLDRLSPHEGSYLDVAAPIGAALPVVIKTLILSH